jgi:hypothetical protein
MNLPDHFTDIIRQLLKDQTDAFISSLVEVPPVSLRLNPLKSEGKVSDLPEDKRKIIRKSHENPSIIKLYNEFLGEPGSHKAHSLLHTEYFPKSNEVTLHLNGEI